MLALEPPATGPREARLEGKDEGDPQLVKHGDARSRLLGLGHLEGTVGEIEVVQLLLHEVGEELGLEVGVGEGFGIGEGVELVAVLEHVFPSLMNIVVKYYLILWPCMSR